MKLIYKKLIYKIANKILSFFSQRTQHRIMLPFSYFLSFLYKGNNVYCFYCKRTFSRFLPHAAFSRLHACCPLCGSLERYRLLYLYLKNKTDFFKKKTKVLDIGPIYNFQKLCLILPNINYTSIDLHSDLATIKMDVMNMTFRDNTFDCIICYHVLEHVENDIKAMQEIYRVLEPNGYAILQVPIADVSRTSEDHSLSGKEREKLYRGRNHLRLYGLDYKYKLESVGFKVRIDDYVKHLSQKIIKRYGLDAKEDIYFCMKK